MDPFAGELAVRDARTHQLHVCRLGDKLVVGRPAPAFFPGIPCDDKHVSRHHCDLELQPDGRLRIDDRSSYGTYVNGVRIKGTAFASLGDKIVIGHDYVLEVLDARGALGAAPTLVETRPVGQIVVEIVAAVNVARVNVAPVHVAPMDLARTEDPDDDLTDVTPLQTALERIGERYTLVREIGRGGMGVVHEAHDDLLGRRCAIKLLTISSTHEDGPELTERFRREAILAAKLSEHPGVVSVFDLGVTPGTGQLYCAMELVHGSSLQTLVERGLDRREGVRIVAETAHAVHFAHERGVIHRDLKPENILVDEAGKARLTDFGIAKVLGELGLTATGLVLGTPSYLAPEQVEDSKRVTRLADVYGLGAVLYHVLTGFPPYTGRSVQEVLKQVCMANLVPPRELDAQIALDLDTLCRQCLARKPDDRPPSALIVATKLEAWLAATAPVERPI